MSKKLYKTAKEKGYKYCNGCLIGLLGKPLRTTLSKRGYPLFSFRDADNIRRVIPAHRFVAYLKYGDKVFEPGLEVRHLDGNACNFSWDNIALGTKSENQMDKPPHIRKRAAVIASSYIKKYNKEEVVEYYLNCKSYKQTMEKFNITSKGTLHYILNR